MKNQIMNQRPKHANEMYIPYAVYDNRYGTEIFEGSEQECKDFAEDVETGRIPANLTIVCIG